MKLKSFQSNRILFGGCAAIMLCALLLAVFGFLFLQSMKDANLYTARRVTREFLENIHRGNIELAYSMLSEKFSPHISKEQFSDYVQQDETIFINYQNLEICDWGIFISDGYVIDTSGLLYYEGGVIAVQISLHKDSDEVWRIQGFRFRPDSQTKPFGLCQ